MQLKRNKEMEFETLKKSYKKQIIIGALAVCVIGGTLTFATTRAKYKVTDSIPIVKGNINYQVPDMKVVAINVSEDGNNYTNANDIPKSGYTLNKSKSVCKVYDGTTSIEDAPKDNNVTIEYHDGVIGIDNISKKNTRCYLYFDKKIAITMDNLIESLSVKAGSPDFSQIATTDEGVYSITDGIYTGTSYYWREAVTNNYVQFAGYCWRIIRINGDRTMRLIYDGPTCHANGLSTVDSIAIANQIYNSSYDRSEYVGWTYSTNTQRTTSGTASNIKSQTDNWYTENIENNTNYSSKVADGKFCNDRNVKSGSTWSSQPTSTLYYTAYPRLISQMKPTLSCANGDIYTLKIGAITMDEVVMAGAKWNTENSNYYLNNGYSYWTMTPSRYESEAKAYVFAVWANGGFGYGTRVSHTLGLRPVINLKADVTFASGGTGTLDNPYVVQ